MSHNTLAALAALVLVCYAVASQEDTCSAQESRQPHRSSSSSSSDMDSVSLMQIALSAARRGSRADKSMSGDHLDSSVQCADLSNNGAYFTVEVGIGTPEQKFDLVADTGSDALIIPDCRCVKSGYCESLSTCFSAGKSSSFGLDIKQTKVHEKHGKKKDSLAIMGAKMNYGSGQIQVLVASERVRVAKLKSKMHNGVFLMEDRRELKVHGDFQGILGLGLPHASPLTKTGVKIPAFMETSQINRYSMCFNEFPHPGSLHVAVPPLKNTLTNIGQVHWGLALHGFSVGDSKSPVIFCDPKDMKKGQKTPCGAIPDSGTTLMMGPAEQIRKLYSSLCDRWPRCKKAAKDLKGKKAEAFHQLLYSCEDWMTDEQGVKEIPSIFLHLAGAEGKPQAVELTAWSFIVETTQEIYKIVSAKVFGDIPMTAAIDTGKKKKICTASFGPQEYDTIQNGHVWIMGAPLFYATTVAYDLGENGTGENAKIAFEPGPCRLCNASASLISSGSVTEEFTGTRIAQRQPRWLAGPIREPDIDASQPL
jgi:hypothetical protein